MRTFIYDVSGEAFLYMAGAGVLYDASNQPLGMIQDEQVVTADAAHLGWFDGAFLWDADGYLLGFVKGAKVQGGLELPKTRPLGFKPQPTPFALHPLLVPRVKPNLNWQWSPQTSAISNSAISNSATLNRATFSKGVKA